MLARLASALGELKRRHHAAPHLAFWCSAAVWDVDDAAEPDSTDTEPFPPYPKESDALFARPRRRFAMIGNSLPEYVFIRACILLLQAVAPAALLWLALRLHGTAPRNTILDAAAAAEALFFLAVYLPLKARWQGPAEHPPVQPPAQRRALLAKILDTIADGERFISEWFRGAPIDAIRRDDLRAYLAWAFFHCDPRDLPSAAEHDELDEFVETIEAHKATRGRRFAPGRGNVAGMRLTLDPVRMKHRPLLWYLLIMLIDHLTTVLFGLAGYAFHHPRLDQLPTTFPPRLQALAPTTRTSPSRLLSYYHHPHTSRTHLPVVLLHGIGIGLSTYVPLLTAINRDRPPTDQIGVIAIENLPVSFRLTPQIAPAATLAAEIRAILFSHGFSRSVLVSHSYGSIVTSHLLKSPDTPPGMFHAAVMIDPVSILVHHASVAYNFIYRPPRTAPEWQLHYFASTDPCVARTLSRAFFWHENTLWRDDLRGVELSAVLGGRDLIVDTKAVASYLSDGQFAGLDAEFVIWDSNGDDDGRQRRRSAHADGANSHADPLPRDDVRVLWFNDADHADVVDVERYRREVVQEIVWRSKRGAAGL